LSKTPASWLRTGKTNREQAGNTRGRSASPQDDLYSALKFEDTYLTSVGLVLDPKLPAQAEAVRIFDNIVERASREMMQNLV